MNEVGQARISGFRYMIKDVDQVRITEGDAVLTHSRRASAKKP
jgi:hypothetical protein